MSNYVCCEINRKRNYSQICPVRLSSGGINSSRRNKLALFTLDHKSEKVPTELLKNPPLETTFLQPLALVAYSFTTRS